ncbi:DUF2726 domain-containing protein [Clostridiales bacterium COT073_COT-073]|nr:DUF2726 domain-containing protein [Clostridiales bacterium COT073_COT-073]
MNQKQMIFIKGQNRSKDITYCEFDSQIGKWQVVFRGSSQVYTYSFENVECLIGQEINQKEICISKNGIEFSGMKEVVLFRGNNKVFWHICFNNGFEEDYPEHELEISGSCLIEEQSKRVFEYLKKIANLSNLKNEETEEKLLPKRYESIAAISSKVALAKYLNPYQPTMALKENKIPIFPFGCNKSQYQAVKNAVENQISVIEGPPGTGKTQTILNIIANILMQGKTVLIASNNNAAIENVYEKLSAPKYDLGFLVAQLGNSENKRKFILEQTKDYPNFEHWRLADVFSSLGEVKKLTEELQEIFDKQEKIASLKQELADLQIEKKHFANYVNESNVSIDRNKLKQNLSSKRIMKLWQNCQNQCIKRKKLGILFRLKSFLFYGIRDWKFYNQEIAMVITTFQWLFLERKEQEIIEQISDYEKVVGNKKSVLTDMTELSMEVLKHNLAEKYGQNKERRIFSEDELWKSSEIVLAEYPVVLSTTFSSKTSLSKEVVYDYLIIDEASQVDIATGALALSCAKNAIIVGDTKQLPNIVDPEAKKEAQEIFNQSGLNNGYHFANSFLQSVMDILPDVAKVLLREHYRCHPKIINFCNQKFYNGNLLVMTEDFGEEEVLSVVKTVKGNHSRGRYNQRQIDVIINEILPDLKIEREEIGIITPYRNQGKKISHQIEGIDVSTVHKFQGREKEAIIISTVDDEITDFTDDPYLLNVAISRAKKNLILVITGNEQSSEKNISDLIAYINYNNFEISDSKIYSIFDYLYTQYTKERMEYLKEHKKVSRYDSENLMYGLLMDIIDSENYSGIDVICHFPFNMLIKNPELLNDRECEYAMNPATHVDFLIFNKVSKRPILVVEVDGYSFHKEGTKQFERDQLKDSILRQYQIPVLRFKTNGSREKEIIVKKLEEFLA